MAAALGLMACGEPRVTLPPEPSAIACPEVSPAPTTTQASNAPAPWGLTRVLEGPIGDLQGAVSGRIEPIPEDCFDGETPSPPRPSMTISTRIEAQAPLVEAVSLRYPGDIACAPIEYCALALRTDRGWWITPHDENVWCDGVIGPSSRIELLDEDLEAPTDQPGLLIYRGTAVKHTRDYGWPDGPREESWSTTEASFTQRCQVTPDGRAHCQR